MEASLCSFSFIRTELFVTNFGRFVDCVRVMILENLGVFDRFFFVLILSLLLGV